MTRNERRRALPLLDDLYREIPRVSCKGLCVDACGPIAMSDAEYHRIAAAAGEAPAIGADADGRCNMLRGNRCVAYSIRPVICRLYGVVRTLACEHGCTPQRWLEHQEGFAFLAKARAIGGEDRSGDADLLAALRSVLDEPGVVGGRHGALEDQHARKGRP